MRRLDLRLREAARLGFARAGVPAVQAGDASEVGLEVVGLETVREAFEALLEAPAEAGPRMGGPPATPEAARA